MNTKRMTRLALFCSEPQLQATVPVCAPVFLQHFSSAEAWPGSFLFAPSRPTDYNAFMLSAAVMAASAVATLFVDAPRPIWSGVGVSIQFTTPAKGEMDLLAKGGFNYVRSAVSWSETERTPGSYDFSKYDGLLRDLKTKRIRPIFSLSGPNSAAQAGAPATPEVRAGYVRWAGELVNHFKGEEIVWELWNEANSDLASRATASTVDTSALLVETAKSMRGADPACRVVAPGVVGVGTQSINSVLNEELLGLIDGVSIRPNREEGPESFAGEIQQLRDLISLKAPEGRKRLPIICSGWGYSTARGKNSEGRQAMYTSRIWLLNSALGVTLTIFDTWQDNGPDPDNPAHRLGLVRENFDLKPSFIAAKEVQEKFRGCTSFRLLPQKDPLDWVIVGAGSGKLVQARWYQKEAGVKFSNLSLKDKKFKTLYASLTGSSELALVPKSLAPKISPTKPIAQLMAGLDFAFAPPLDDDGWCVLIQKSSAETAKLEFRYQRANGANVTCYARIESARAVEPLATIEDTTSFSVGMNGAIASSYRIQRAPLNFDEWSLQKEGKLSGELSAGQRGAIVSYEGAGKALVAPKSRMAIPDGAKSLVVWMRPDGSANRLKSEFKDSSGQIVSIDLGSMEGATDRNGWRVVKIPLQGTGVEWVSLFAVEAERERGGTIEIGPAAYMF